jgi:hypothetical protein
MKVKVKKGIGVISNQSRTFIEGVEYDIPDNKFDSDSFDAISTPFENKNRRGKK